jgi:hypothetical protein
MQRFYCNGKQDVCTRNDSCIGCKFLDCSGGNYIEVDGEDSYVEDKNPYWERICEISQKQRAKGIETYGQGLETNPLTIMERLTYLEEELIDGLMYIEHIKAWIDESYEVPKGE